MNTFDNQIIWITGSSSGLGEALAIALANKNANIILSGRNKEALERVKAKIPHSKIVVFDMEDTTSFQEKTREALEAFGRIDMVIHNAGVAQNSLAAETPPEVEQRIMQVDYYSPIALTKCLLPHFLERKSGKIVVISGLLAYINLPGRSTYAAAKAALIGYFGCMRSELRSKGVDVAILIPGSLKTELVNKAIMKDGSTATHKRSVAGYALEKAAAQILNALSKGKHQCYIGNFKGFMMWKLSTLCPDFVIKKVFNMVR